MTKRIVLLAVIAGLAHAQSQAPLAFEVASVKQDTRQSWVRRPWTPNIDCAPIGHCGVSGTRFTEEYASLVDLIMDAYKVKRFQVAGLPNWGDSGRDVYDIEAKVDGDQPPTLDQARRMLQTLLADRFQLKLHHETRELPVYSLVVAKNGPKLAPRRDLCLTPGATIIRADGTRVTNDKTGGSEDSPKKATGKPGLHLDLGFIQTWAFMPEFLSGLVDRPVVDKTGFTEAAYCTLDGEDPTSAMMDVTGPLGGSRGGDPHNQTSIPDPGSTGASIFTAVEEKWGLKLDPQKAPVDVLVIDHVERPSEN